MDYEITYLNNRVWIQRTALVLAVTVLEYNFTSRVDQICFVEALCTLDVSKVLDVEHNFDNLLNILKSILKFNKKVELDFSKIYDLDEYKLMVVTYLEILIANCEFEEALSIAEMEGMNKDNILIAQFKSFAQKHTDVTFWKDCNDTFHKNLSAPQTVIEFFQEFSKTMKDVSYEKYLILKFAYEWALQSSYFKLDEIEREMWVSYIKLQVKDKSRALEANLSFRPYIEMKEELINVRFENLVEIDNFNENMDDTISVLLNFGYYWEALKLAKMFDYKHIDLEILKLCSSVAENLITVDEFNKQQGLLLCTESSCRPASFRTSKISHTYNGKL